MPGNQTANYVSEHHLRVPCRCDLKVSGDELNRLRDKYPAWHIWMSQARRLWATRKGRVSLCPGRDYRWSMTIDADTFQDLDRKLEEQILLG